jgi:hypothetical protein
VEPRTHQWMAIDRSGVQAGDMVSAEAGGLPIYRVLAREGQSVRLLDDRNGRDHLAPLAALHWKLSRPGA